MRNSSSLKNLGLGTIIMFLISYDINAQNTLVSNTTGSLQTIVESVIQADEEQLAEWSENTPAYFTEDLSPSQINYLDNFINHIYGYKSALMMSYKIG